MLPVSSAIPLGPPPSRPQLPPPQAAAETVNPVAAVEAVTRPFERPEKPPSEPLAAAAIAAALVEDFSPRRDSLVMIEETPDTAFSQVLVPAEDADAAGLVERAARQAEAADRAAGQVRAELEAERIYAEARRAEGDVVSATALDIAA